MEQAAKKTFEELRGDFPIFRHRPALAYLDTAATAQVPEAVIEAVIGFEAGMRSNVHRGVYSEAETATEAYEAARGEVARFMNADIAEVSFTSGTTAGMNMVADLLAPRLQPGDGVLVSSMEHHSALLPWRKAADARCATLTTIPHTPEYRFDLGTFRLMLNDRVKVVVVTAASNVLGTVNQIAEIVTLAHAVGAIVVVDAAQYVPHAALDVQAWGADVVLFSGHKLYGPMGTGVLYIEQTLGASLTPTVLGGGMMREVLRSSTTYEDAPWKFEAGTPNVSGAIGLAAAIRYLSAIGFTAIDVHETNLLRELMVGLLSCNDISIIGPDALFDRVGVVSFIVPGLHPHDVATLLGESGIAIRAGHHCAMPLVMGIAPEGVCRASLGLYSSLEDVARLIDGLRAVRAKLG